MVVKEVLPLIELAPPTFANNGWSMVVKELLE